MLLLFEISRAMLIFSVKNNYKHLLLRSFEKIHKSQIEKIQQFNNSTTIVQQCNIHKTPPLDLHKGCLKNQAMNLKFKHSKWKCSLSLQEFA